MKTAERKVLNTNEISGNIIEKVQTDIETLPDGSIFIGGYVEINGEPQYEFEQHETKTGIILQRTCGFGQGCFWTEWQ